jgi:hypothetical protein
MKKFVPWNEFSCDEVAICPVKSTNGDTWRTSFGPVTQLLLVRESFRRCESRHTPIVWHVFGVVRILPKPRFGRSNCASSDTVDPFLVFSCVVQTKGSWPKKKVGAEVVIGQSD